MRKLFCVIIILLFVSITGLDAKGNDKSSDQVLWEHLQRRSKIQYAAYVKKHGGAVNIGDWVKPINAAFVKIVSSSGYRPFNISYSVIRNKSFNAAAFPGGQFIVHTFTLKVLDGRAKARMKRDGDTGKQRGLNWYRERAIAPILAHELGHYYNRHTFATIKKYWSFSNNKIDKMTLELVKHSHKQELEADVTGYILLKRAKYNKTSMIELLNMMNYVRQHYIKKGVIKHDFYVSSHPSAHTRLAALDHKGKKFHKWASLMERTFDDIQFSRNLRKALRTIEDALEKYPNNVHFQKAYAVALHKSWLATVPLHKQQFRAIIDIPSFRDEMIILRSRGIRRGGPPGNKRLYYKTLRAYDKLSWIQDPAFQSNHGVLLVYSGEKNRISKAIRLAASAAKKQPTYATYSNYCTVLFLAGYKKRAIQTLAALAVKIDAKFTNAFSLSKSNPKVSRQVNALYGHIKKCQMLDKGYVFSSFTPILNLALMFSYSGNKRTAKVLANEYLSKYDQKSLWAKYLSRKTRVKIKVPKRSSSALLVKGVKVGDSIKTVMKYWKKPTRIGMDNSGNEIWQYQNLGINIMVESGFVMFIQIVNTRSPKVGKRFGIGSSKKSVERYLGKPKRVKGLYYFYHGKQNAAVKYVLGFAKSIVLLR